ncbi:MAG TPA: transposase [Burkholderiales bacterium]|nr:transposase [Burkholderiales bacterium]
MPRAARIQIPELSLHVVQRGHDRDDCFFEEADYIAYLDYLSSFATRFACSIHAYCLMTNHVHLLVTPHSEQACTQMMRFTNQYYVQRINKRLARSGTLWEGRFYSGLVPSERYALGCYRYIELNPVDAKMVPHPRDYHWSSYAANTGAFPGFVSPHPAYAALGIDATTRARAYLSLFDVPLERKLVDDIRRATRGGYVVGSDRKKPGRPRRPVMRKIGSVPN